MATLPKSYQQGFMENGKLVFKTVTPFTDHKISAPVVPPQSSFLSSNNQSTVVNPPEKPKTPPPVSNPAPAPAPTPPPTRSKYINPETGKYFQTAEEYGNYVATKIPASKQNGDIPAYAGDAMTNPDKSAVALQGDARNLNNARNDIAVGATDPYKVGNQSGIAYSPTELKAIEKAYAGIYDPALNDVFARLKEKQTSDAKAIADKAAADKKIADRENQIFQTNENIRQWKATTGSKKGGGGSSDLFTQTQLNNGARNAGMTIAGFSTLDEDLQNFFVQPPSSIDDITGKTVKISTIFEGDIADVKAGKKKTKAVADDITASTLPESVKHYYIDQLPLQDVEKQGYFSKIWGAVGNTVKSIFGQ